jgi:thiamine-monophosphate kinase
LSELSRLQRLRRLFSRSPLPEGVATGIGDDAAVLVPGSAALVWTVDAAVEGVHFRRDWMALEDVGFRSLMAAASDLAAMGARPRGVLSALILPADFGDEDLDRLASGQAEAAAALGTSVIGGNLARGRELSITTTVLGAAERPLLRAGAAPGDVLAVSGALGLAGAGVQALSRSGHAANTPAGAARQTAPQKALERAVAAYRRPRALIDAGLAAAPRAHAAIDVSDGLALDATRLAAESGVAIVFEADKVLAAGGAELVHAAAALSLDALDLALYGGDDYALLMAFTPGELVPGFRPVGSCVAGTGVLLQGAIGGPRQLEARGYDHFSGDDALSR